MHVSSAIAKLCKHESGSKLWGTFGPKARGTYFFSSSLLSSLELSDTTIYEPQIELPVPSTASRIISSASVIKRLGASALTCLGCMVQNMGLGVYQGLEIKVKGVGVWV